MLVLPDVVQEDAVEPLAEPADAGGEFLDGAGYQHGTAQLRVVGRPELVELVGQGQVPDAVGGDARVPPLIARRGHRLRFVVLQAEVHLQVCRPPASGLPIGGLDPARLVALRSDRDQAVRPRRRLGRSVRGHCGGQQRRRHLRQAPDPRLMHLDGAGGRDQLAAQQVLHERGAGVQPPVALLLRRPGLGDDVLVQGLSAAERGPEPAREHLRRRGDGLREHCRVVAAGRRGHHADRERGRRECRAQPRPGMPGVTLPGAPGSEVVGAHRRVETRLLGARDHSEQLPGGVLLVRSVESDPHANPSGRAAAAIADVRALVVLALRLARVPGQDRIPSGLRAVRIFALGLARVPGKRDLLIGCVGPRVLLWLGHEPPPSRQAPPARRHATCGVRLGPGGCRVGTHAVRPARE
ncbi:hypothetical protein MICRO8M_80585 [Microbacterium sp. 8M]|nr:hypothetical protein MICRO8M_80585 [Microbacterium sp. 8M]